MRACWFLHSNITAELYAAMCMEYKVWEEQAPGLGPMMLWHAHVDMLVGRLRRMGEDAGCESSGAHREPEAFGERGAFELDYDESVWQAHTAGWRESETLARPGEGVRFVRAAVVDADGKTATVSNPVGMRACEAPELAARLAVVSGAADEMAVLDDARDTGGGDEC